ncbi:MAG: hypothetical protein ACLTDX_14220 [[Clostridium] innocuum]
MSKETPYIFAKNQIRMILRKGKDNAISRPMLKQITGMDDRTNRNIIKDLRIEGIPIMSVIVRKKDTGCLQDSVRSRTLHQGNKTSAIKELTLTVKGLESWLREHADELED